jgi:succinoglycan biosynthesis protein ExoA
VTRVPPLVASVLTPVVNEEAHLRDAAEAMLAQRVEGGLEFLFIDGGSTDGTLELLEALKRRDERVRVLHNPARYTPAALNIGLRAAQGRYVVRMDAHTLYPDGYIDAGIRRLERGGVAHVSGPQLAGAYDEGSRRVALALASRVGIGGASFRRLGAEIEVDSGFLGVWPRDVLLRLGGWDEAWINNQDAELAARLRAAGGRIVCIPEMTTRYLPRNSLARLARQYWGYGLYRAKTVRRHPGSLRRSHLLPPGLVLGMLAAVVLPGPLARPARLTLGAYAALLLAESIRIVAQEEVGRPADAVHLPLVFAAMHLPWGAGFLIGSARRDAP